MTMVMTFTIMVLMIIIFVLDNATLPAWEPPNWASEQVAPQRPPLHLLARASEMLGKSSGV